MVKHVCVDYYKLPNMTAYNKIKIVYVIKLITLIIYLLQAYHPKYYQDHLYLYLHSLSLTKHLR